MITLRMIKGLPLTYDELDNNFISKRIKELQKEYEKKAKELGVEKHEKKK